MARMSGSSCCGRCKEPDEAGGKVPGSAVADEQGVALGGTPGGARLVVVSSDACCFRPRGVGVCDALVVGDAL